MLSIYTHQLFPPFRTFSMAIEIVLEYLPQTNKVKNAHHTQSWWIVALLLCNNWCFILSIVRAYYVVLQEAMTSSIYLF
jgi:hypothetical protein